MNNTPPEDMSWDDVEAMKQRVIRERLPMVEQVVDGLIPTVREQLETGQMSHDEAVIHMGASINSALGKRLKNDSVESQIAARDLMIAVALIKLAERNPATETGSAMVEVDE